MNINATFLVQLVHIALAYYLIKRILFIPWLRVLHQEDTQKKQVHEEIQRITHRIAYQEEIRQQKWHDFKQFAAHHSPALPDILPKISRIHIPPGHPVLLQAGVIERYMQEAQHFLMDRFSS